jgi:hypothetical protein
VPQYNFLHWFSVKKLCSKEKETAFSIARCRSVYIRRYHYWLYKELHIYTTLVGWGLSVKFNELEAISVHGQIPVNMVANCITNHEVWYRFHAFYRSQRPLGRERYSPTKFLDLSAGRGWVGAVSVTPQPFSTPGKDPVPIVQEAVWAPGPVWTGAENLTLIGIRSPDHPALSQSLYRLSYPAHWSIIYRTVMRKWA